MKITALDREEQALVLAVAISPELDAPPLARVAGEARARCQDALDELRALSADGRRRRLALLGRSLFAPIPPHLSRVHPSWIVERLEAEPARIAVRVSEAIPPGPGAPSGRFRSSAEAAPAPPVSAALCRAVLGDLPWLPPAHDRPGPPRSPEELLGWSTDRLLHLIERLGSAHGEPGPDGRAREVGARILGAGIAPQLRPALALLLPVGLGRALLSAPASLDRDGVLELVSRVAEDGP